MNERTQRRYDFFISRAGADVEVAKEVADVLRQAGHTVQYQDEDIPIGANFIERMSSLVEDCKHLLIILSPAYLASEYCREEWTNFLADLFSEQSDRRVVVLLAGDCKPPGILRARVFGSLFDKSDPTERRLSIIAAAEGRAARIRIDPAVFHVAAPRNHAFCGREETLATLEGMLIGARERSAVLPVALIGPGGVGKSSIATEYAYLHSGEYWGVWWLPAGSRVSLLAGLVELARGIDPALRTTQLAKIDELERVAKATLSRLRSAPLPWLLIYDNVDSPSSIADLLPPRGAHVLLTTRWSAWHGIAEELNVDILPQEIARDFLVRRANKPDPVSASRLASALNYLPLALEQAGALCKRTGISFDDYAQRLHEFIRIKPQGGSYPNSVFGTFNIAIGQAAATCPDAEKVMSMLAFLHPDGIPISLISEAVMDVTERTLAIEALSGVSLISVKDGHVKAHRLIQEVMRQRIHESREFASLRPAISQIARRGIEHCRNDGLTQEYAYENVLWALHHDPSTSAALEDVDWMPNQDVDLMVSFWKTPEGVRKHQEARMAGRLIGTYDTLYYLDGGWKERILSSRYW